MKKILISLLALAAVSAAAYYYFGKGEEAVKYGTEKATKGDIESTVTATGNVTAVTTVLIGTQVSGTIKEIFVDFNSPVKKGQVIARIDPGIFQAQVSQANANLIASKANLDKTEAALKDAKRTLERNKELYAKDLISKSELDASSTNYDIAFSQVGASKAQILQSEAALKLARTNLDYTEIASPVNGIVVSRAVDIGQTVAASFQTPTLFTIAEDLTKMQVNCNIAEADIGKIKTGLPVEFTVDAYPETVFKGNVSEVRISPIIEQNVVTYNVVTRVSNPELKLMPGMTANVSIIYASKKGVLKVSNRALRFTPDDNAGKNSKGRAPGAGVWVMEGEKPVRIEIKTGISDGAFTEVVSGGLTENHEVIVESTGKPKNRNRSAPRFF